MPTRNRWKIYKIERTESGSCYVGMTQQLLKQRWSEHCSRARKGSDRAIHRAIRKYGPEAFIIDVIDSADTLDEAFMKEVEWIKRLGTFSDRKHYNSTKGGDGVGVGEDSPLCELSDQEVLSAIEVYRNTDATQYDVAKKFGINQGHFSKLNNGKCRPYLQHLVR